jgi:hypothetical protein
MAGAFEDERTKISIALTYASKRGFETYLSQTFLRDLLTQWTTLERAIQEFYEVVDFSAGIFELREGYHMLSLLKQEQTQINRIEFERSSQPYP